MKKIGLLLLVACVSFFAACGDDDDDKKPVEDFATAVAGTYTGDLKVGVAGTSPSSVGEKNIQITKTGENIVSLALKNFTFGEGDDGLNIKEINIPNVQVKKDANNYKIELAKAAELELKATMKDPATGKEIEITIPATVNISKGNFVDKKMDLELSIKTTFPTNLNIVVTIQSK